MDDRAHPPDGEFTIARAGYAAVLLATGGGIRSLTADGTPLLADWPAGAPAPAAAGQILAPWPGRIRDGRYAFAGRTHQLAITEPERGCATHGLVRDVPWTVVEHAPDAITMTCPVGPRPGYPGALDLTVRWSVGPDGLRAEHTATNTGTGPAPYGLGAHPYLLPPTGRIDDTVLHLPVTERVVGDERMLPLGREPVAGTAHDFGTPRPMGDTWFDTAFTGQVRDDDGIARVRLSGAGRTTEIWCDAAFGWWQVFSCDELPGSWRRRAVAVEPMTCPPDAFRTGVDRVVLAPGGTHVAGWGIRSLRTP